MSGCPEDRARRRVEGVLCVAYPERRLFADDGDDVEARRLVDAVQAEVGVGRTGEVCLFRGVDGVFGRAEAFVTPRLDLDKDNLAVPLGHDVDLQVAAAPVDVVQGVALVHQVACGGFFAAMAEEVVLRHGLRVCFLAANVRKKAVRRLSVAAVWRKKLTFVPRR